MNPGRVTDSGVERKPNGDFSLYCYWREMNHQLVPRQLPFGERSHLVIDSSFLLSTRGSIRRRIDLHALPTATGEFVSVMRFGVDAHFTSMQRRPIYASITLLQEGLLAGAVETNRGVTWLVVHSPVSPPTARWRRLAYDLWSGFLGFFDTLVLEVEAALNRTTSGPLEVRLDLADVYLPVYDAFDEIPSGPIDIRVSVKHEARLTIVRCPENLLAGFQQSENTAEKLIVRAFARGLASMHQAPMALITDAWLESMADRVVGSDVKVLHLFSTHDAAEHLLSRHGGGKGVILPHDDFTFAKLDLAIDCTSAPAGSVLTSKDG